MAIILKPLKTIVNSMPWLRIDVSPPTLVPGIYWNFNLSAIIRYSARVWIHEGIRCDFLSARAR